MTALVVGVGLTGRSLVSHLLALGEDVLAIDSRQSPPAVSSLPVEVRLGEDFRRWPASKFKQFSRVALSPGVSPDDIAAAPETLTGDAALFSEAWAESTPQTTLIAVTGTNGKSSTVAMTSHLCREAGGTADAVGNIGEPLLDALGRWQKNGFPDVAIAEISSFQLQTTAVFNSDAAAVLNVSDDHLDRHGNMRLYGETKARLYNGAAAAVVNGDDVMVSAMKTPALRRVFALNQDNADWRLYGDSVIANNLNDLQLPLAQMSLAARQQPGNVLAALSLMDAAHLHPTGKGLENFVGLPHRRQVIATAGGLTFIDDSKATNVAAACVALVEMKTQVVLIVGGEGKGQDFTPLAKAALGVVRFAVLFGKDAKALAPALSEVATAFAEDMEDALAKAIAAAQNGDTVLLSPACSSLDMFKDYTERGKCFSAAVKRKMGI